MTEWEDVERSCGRVFMDCHRESVVQLAWIYWHASPHRSAWRLSTDAMRQYFFVESRQPLQLKEPDAIASHYPTEAQLLERWADEETEDQLIEWLRLPAAERDRRSSEAMRALGTLCPEHT